MPTYVKLELALYLLSHFCDKQNGNPHFLNGIKTAKDVLKNMPKEEVRPVIHASWKVHDEHTFGFTDRYYVCTNCGLRVPEEKFTFPKEFCPHCNAQMSGGKIND